MDRPEILAARGADRPIEALRASAAQARARACARRRRATAPTGCSQQHAGHQLGVDRRTAHRAVEGTERPTDVAQLDEAVDRAQQVVGGNVLLEAEAVEQRLPPDPPLAHHGPVIRRLED